MPVPSTKYKSARKGGTKKCNSIENHNLQHTSKGKWEKERRKRLNDAFERLNKLLPSYDPSISAAKIDIIDKAAELITDLNDKLKKTLTSEDKENTKDDVLVKFESRLKKLLLRNEFLSNLLKDARIKVPDGYGFVKKKLPKWSNRVTSEQAKVLQKKTLEKEITDCIPTKPIKRKKTNENSKPKNLQLLSIDKKRKRRKLGSNSKGVIIISQAAPVNKAFYVVSKNEVNHTKTAIIQSSLLRVPLVSANPPSLGPNAFVFPSGSIVPINQAPVPQPTLIANPIQTYRTSTLIIVSKQNDSLTKGNPLNLSNDSLIPINQPAIPQPTVIANANQNNGTSTIIIVSKPNLINAGKSFVAPLPIVTIPQFITNLNNHVFQTSFNQWSQIRPKFCSTNTTQVNKLPIPALTSKYNNYVYVHTAKPSAKELPKGKETKNKVERKKETQKRKDIEIVNQKAKKQKNNLDASTGDKKQNKNDLDSTNICQSKKVISENVSDIVSAHGKDIEAGNTQSLDKQDQSVDQAEVIKRLDNKENSEKGEKQNDLHVNEGIPEEKNDSEMTNINTNSPPKIVEPEKTPTNDCKEDKDTNHKPNQLDLPLSHSELSNDIFASLNVPPGCQNPDSTSPTAAFLMAFPLVTGTKVSEVVDSDNNDNSQRETPNLLQIGTMDETKATQSQSQSESTTPNPFNFESFSFFSQKDYTQFGVTSSVPALSTSLPATIFSNSYTSKMGIFDDLFYSQAVSSLSSYSGNISSIKPVPTTNHQTSSDSNIGLSKLSDTQVVASITKASLPSYNPNLLSTKADSESSHNSNPQPGRDLISDYKHLVASTSIDTNIVFSMSVSTTTPTSSIYPNSKCLIKNSNAVISKSNNLSSTGSLSVPKSIFNPESTVNSNIDTVPPTTHTKLLISQTEQGQHLSNAQGISDTSKFASNLAITHENQMYTNKNEIVTSQHNNKQTLKHFSVQPITAFSQTNTVSSGIESTKVGENIIQSHSSIGNSNTASTAICISSVLPVRSISSSKNNTTVADNKIDNNFPISIYGNPVTNSFNYGAKVDISNIPASNTQGSKQNKTFSDGGFGYYLPYENVYDHNRKINFAAEKKVVKQNTALSKLSESQNTSDLNVFGSNKNLNAASGNKVKDFLNERLAEAMTNIHNQHHLPKSEAQNILNQQIINSDKPKQDAILAQINDKSFNSFKESKTLYNESCKDIFNCTQTKIQEAEASKSSKLPEHTYQPNFFENHTQRDLYPAYSEKVNSNTNYYGVQPPATPAEKIVQSSLPNTNQKTNFSAEYLNAYNVKSDSVVNTNRNITSQNFNFSLYPQKVDKSSVSSAYNNSKLNYDAKINQNSNIHTVNPKLCNEIINNKNERSLNPNPEQKKSKHSSTHQIQYTGIQNYKVNPYFPNSKQTTKTSKSIPDFVFNSNQGMGSEQFSLNAYAGDHKKNNESNQNSQAVVSNIAYAKNEPTGNSKENTVTGNFNLHHSNLKNPQNKCVDNNLKFKLDSAGNHNQNMGPNNFNFDFYSLDAKKKNDLNAYPTLKYNKGNYVGFSNQNQTNYYTQVNRANNGKDKNDGLNSNQSIANQNFNINPYLNVDMKKKHDQNLQIQQKEAYSNKTIENLNYANKKVSCTYAPSVSNPCYTNANTNYYDYNSENNYGNSYLKTSSNTGNNYYFNYDACSESRKNDAMASNSYGSSLDPYNRDKFASIITTKSKPVTQQIKPVNWMTAPNNISSKDYLLPPFSTKDSNAMYNTSFPSSVVSSGYFNTVSSYNSGEISSSDKKNVDIGLPNYNASFQKGQGEENQFSWSPSKIPPFLDPAHSFVSATLPTLVGDLALNTQPSHIESKLNKEKTCKSNIRKTKPTFDNQNNQSNFLSVSQLVENKEQTPVKVASRRNSGNKNRNIPPEKAKRVKKSEQNKTDENTQIKVAQSQSSEQPQSIKEYNKNPVSSYSAEALISQPVQSYSKKSKSFVPNFMTDNCVTYFPPIDPQESNNFISQQSVYSSASFPHSFSNSLQNNTSTTNSIMSNPPTTYLTPGNFLNEHEFYDMYNPSVPVIKEKPGTKDGIKSSFKSDKSLNINCKKSKKRNLNDGVLPSFEIPFLSIPGAINSPLLPDDFHHTFLPPSTPYKNPLYPPKQNADIGALLPPLPTVTGSKASVPNHDVSPSINAAGTSLTNFNLSTIFPEINKGPPSNHGNAPPQSFASSSSGQGQSSKPTFTFSSYSS